MADKRISQLIERTDILNNDVLPIVASGATTTNKVTISTIQDWMQSNLDVGVTSVGLTMPSAFQVSGSPITTSGNITVTAAGTASQYIRGDGTLADFPTGGGGGSSVSYYLNGSVSQGTIGGVAYQELSKTPILGAGTDFTISADGYIASFITDVGDPGLLEIPAGNWNFETYLQASSGGGTPTFYIELYKVSYPGNTATLIASNSGSPELIAFGTSINPYFSALAVPQTTLALTDRLALRYYVTHSGRTITMHTENNTLCQIITTFTTGLTALNGLTAQVQNFATGTSGTDFNISSTGSIHTFNLPDASASNRGAVTTGTQTFAGYKIFNGTIGVNNDIQLATQGTALNTFIKNINATGLTSIGSNGFGFNNANNIYFSGSNKGGGVFAFSNTGTQIYTLPNASGTISLTSDLGAYLPLSGGTMTGAINGISANFTSNLSSDSGVYSNTAFFAKHNPGSTVTVNGWNAMQGDANTFIVLNSTKGMRINFPSNASFTHTLPDASGTIALTSNLSSYLPLSGGTLTGALNGTNASFSAGVTNQVTNISADGAGVVLQGYSDNNLRIAVRGSGYNDGARGGLLASTGDFSSSVTAGGINTFLSGGFNNSTYALNASISSNASASSVAPVARFSNNGGGNVTKIMLSDNNRGDAFITHVAGSAFVPSSRWLGFGVDAVDQMVINASGNVGIGTASPETMLHINRASAGGEGGFIFLDNSAGSTLGNKAGIRFATNSGATFSGYGSFIEALNTNAGNGAESLTFGTWDGAAREERMRITAGGNVGIGTASPDTFSYGGNRNFLTLRSTATNQEPFLQIIANGVGNSLIDFGNESIRRATIIGENGSNLVFYTNGSNSGTGVTERMRITSGGYLWSTNSSYWGSSANHQFNTNANGNTTINFYHQGTDPYGFYTEFTGAAPNNTSNYFAYFRDTVGAKCVIFSNGNIQNLNNSYGAISDAKLKENIEDATPKLDDLMKVKVRNYNLIGDDKKQIGVIAQELEEVFPAMIDESEDFEEVEVPQVDEEGNEILNEEGEVVTTKERVSKGTTTKSVKYSVFVPMLIKAMQEQQEQIKSLTEQVEALKSQING